MSPEVSVLKEGLSGCMLHQSKLLSVVELCFTLPELKIPHNLEKRYKVCTETQMYSCRVRSCNFVSWIVASLFPQFMYFSSLMLKSRYIYSHFYGYSLQKASKQASTVTWKASHYLLYAPQAVYMLITYISVWSPCYIHVAINSAFLFVPCLWHLLKPVNLY